MTDDDTAAKAASAPGAAREPSVENGHAISGMTEATIRQTIAQLEMLLPERTLTIGELFDRHHLTLPRDMAWVGSMRSTMKRFLARFGSMQVAKFGPADWESYRDDPAIRSHYCVTTRGIQLRRAKAMFNWATASGRIPFNPIDRVKHERGKPKRETEITHEGEAQVLRRSDPLLRAFILVAVDGAMRRNEARLIEWTHVDFVGRTVTLHAANTKTKKTRIVRLTPRAIEAIRKLPRYPGCPYVFASRHTKKPYNETTLWRRWRTAADDAGLKAAPGDETVRYHDLRGTAISRLSRLGASVPVIQKLVGHGSMQTTMTYIRVNSADVEAAYALLTNSQRKGPQRAKAKRAHSVPRKKASA